MELRGILMEKEPEKNPTNQLRIQEFYVDCSTTNSFSERFENVIKIQAINDRINALDQMQIGDPIKVSYTVRGRFKEAADGQRFHNQNFNMQSIQKITTQ